MIPTHNLATANAKNHAPARAMIAIAKQNAQKTAVAN